MSDEEEVTVSTTDDLELEERLRAYIQWDRDDKGRRYREIDMALLFCDVVAIFKMCKYPKEEAVAKLLEFWEIVEVKGPRPQ